MPNLEAGTRKRTYAVIGLVAATTVALTIAAASPPRITASRPALQLVHAPRSGPSQFPPAGNQDASSALQPTEMLQGCFDCPLSSYLGKIGNLP